MSRSGTMRSGNNRFITSSSDIPLNLLCFRRAFFSALPSSPRPSILMSRSSPSAMTSFPSPSPSSSSSSNDNSSLKSPLKERNFMFYKMYIEMFIHLLESSFICIDKIPSGFGDFGFLGFLGFWALGAMSGIGIPENPIESGLAPRLGGHISSSLVGKL